MVERDEPENLSPVEKAHVLSLTLNSLLTELASDPLPEIRAQIIKQIQTNYDRAMMLLVTEDLGDVVRAIDQANGEYYAAEASREKVIHILSSADPLAIRLAKYILPKRTPEPSLEDFFSTVPEDYQPLVGMFFDVNAAMRRSQHQIEPDKPTTEP